MKARDKKIAQELKRRLYGEVGDSILRLIFFGSRIKGGARRDSDLDVAVILKRRSGAIESRLDEVAYQVMWDYDFSPIISLKIFDRRKFDSALRKGYSFYRELATRGLEL